MFPFYIVHQSIIVGVGYWLLGTGLGNGAAFAVLLAATAAGCAGFYWGGRMIGPIRPFIGLARPSSPNAAAPIAAARQSLA